MISLVVHTTSMFNQAKRVKEGKDGFVASFGRLFPYVSLCIAATVWTVFSKAHVAQNHPQLWIGMLGFMSANIIVSPFLSKHTHYHNNLQLAHMAKSLSLSLSLCVCIYMCVCVCSFSLLSLSLSLCVCVCVCVCVRACVFLCSLLSALLSRPLT